VTDAISEEQVGVLGQEASALDAALQPHTDAAIPFGEPSAHDQDPDIRRRFFGKYRATVVDNVDPLSQGRLILQIPDVLGLLPSDWAMPCLPFAGISMGSFVRPIPGAGVWAEFEQGDPQFPIWTGCYWNEPPQSIPLAARQAPPGVAVVTVETPTGGLSICDTPVGAFGAVCLRSGAAQIALTSAGVRIEAPSVSVITSQFSVNGASLVVT
jgi:hypothetical protein